MTREDIDNIISVICPNDEDYEKPIISPAYLKKELEILALEQEGHWITKRTIMHDGEFYCDICGNDAPFNKTFHFCPNCGSMMKIKE